MLTKHLHFAVHQREYPYSRKPEVTLVEKTLRDTDQRT